MPNDTEIRIAVKVDLPKEVDRAMEIEAARRDVTKRQFIEDALRAYMKLPAKKSAA